MFETSFPYVIHGMFQDIKITFLYQNCISRVLFRLVTTLYNWLKGLYHETMIGHNGMDGKT